MNPKQFLLIGGVVLVVVGLAGFFGIIGPTPEQSFFKEVWWFDNGENWAHLVLGIVALIAAFIIPGSLQKPLVIVLGVVGVIIGIYSIFRSDFLGANLENPADTILHIVVGIWALASSMMKSNTMTSGPTSSPTSSTIPSGM